MRTIVIGCDNAAVHLKNELTAFMEKKGYTVENMGCDSTEDTTYYPYVAEKVCRKMDGFINSRLEIPFWTIIFLCAGWSRSAWL